MFRSLIGASNKKKKFHITIRLVEAHGFRPDSSKRCYCIRFNEAGSGVGVLANLSSAFSVGEHIWESGVGRNDPINRTVDFSSSHRDYTMDCIREFTSCGEAGGFEAEAWCVSLVQKSPHGDSVDGKLGTVVASGSFDIAAMRNEVEVVCACSSSAFSVRVRFEVKYSPISFDDDGDDEDHNQTFSASNHGSTMASTAVPPRVHRAHTFSSSSSEHYRRLEGMSAADRTRSSRHSHTYPPTRAEGHRTATTSSSSSSSRLSPSTPLRREDTDYMLEVADEYRAATTSGTAPFCSCAIL